MSNSILPAAGNLDIVNAKVRADKFEATTSLAVSNAEPDFDLSVGTVFHVDKDSVDPVSVTGNVVASGIKISNLTISPAFDFASVSNVGNVTANVIQFANATTGFTTTANVEIGGNITLTSNAQVKVGSNVLAEYTGPHGREPTTPLLKKFPEIDFAEGKFDKNDTTNTYVQAGYTVTASWSKDPDGGANPIWKAFNGNTNEAGMLINNINYDNNGNANTTGTTASILSASDSTPYGEWLKLELPNKIKLNKYAFTSRNTSLWTQSVEAGQVWGSNNDSNWAHLHTFTNSGFTGASQTASFNVTTNNYYKYYAFIVTKTFDVGTNQYLCIPELKYYGREEPAPPGDLSLDTTLKSTFNSVRSNNYVMYFDGEDPASGNVPKYLPSGSAKSITPNNIVFDATNNCWTLNGSTESNVTTGSLGLVGDAPHTVSTWINASNLEANATTQQLFSIGSGYDKALVRVDDTQIAANTWHNVTYAYQGEGGSKVTYVDGRKVGEAQIEDTFGEYPPIPMTDYKTGGYCVSASGEYPGTAYLAHEAFNGTVADNGDCWLSTDATYDANTGNYNGSANLGTGADDGEWLKLEMPHKLLLDYITICGSTTGGVNPKDWKIYGSNDDKNWDVLLSKTNAVTAAYNATSGKEHTVGASKAYKYFALVVTKSGGNSTSHYIQVGELEFYGHREYDLTRFPEPTRVLKYPHVTMTGPARRGYVVTTNSELASTTAAWKAFDGNDGVHWQTATGSFGTSGDFSAVSGQTFTGYTGHWVKLDLPHKIELTRFKMKQFNHANQQPKDYVLLGSNNDSSWTLIHAETAANMPGGVSSGTEDVTSFSAGTPAAYKYIKLLVRKLEGSGGSSAGYMTIDEIEYYGTQEDTGTPAIVGGPFAGKVANFRVYDQYLGDERIQEIYDAQKDAFGHKKSSMTFYKGRVGVGTTEPEGALTVIDEPHALERFPVRAISSNYSYVEGEGCVKISTARSSDGSSESSGGGGGGGGYGGGGGGGGGSSSGSSKPGFSAFDGLTSTCWSSIPTRHTRLSEEVDFGAWLKIQTPESMSLKKAEIESKPDWMQVGDTINDSAEHALTSSSFGMALDCSDDGTRVIVGAYLADVSGTNRGQAFVFDWNGSDWVRVGNILQGTQNDENLGYAVAISGDGNYIAVGNPYYHNGAISDAGRYGVFYLNGATWTILPDSGSLTGTTSPIVDYFVGSSLSAEAGWSLRLSYDGKTIAAGYRQLASGAGGAAGQIRVHTYANGAWTLKGQNLNGLESADRLGYSVKITPDGNYLIAGAPYGAKSEVYVYDYNSSSSQWDKRTTLSHPTLPNANTHFYGSGIAISDDGNTVAVGASQDDTDGTNYGRVYVYTWSGSAWTLVSTLTSPLKGTVNEYFGASVDLSGDGKRLVAAAPFDNVDVGYAFTFEYNGASWQLRDHTTIGSVGVGINGRLGEFYTGLVISRDGSTIVGGNRAGNHGKVRVWNMPSNIKSIWGSTDDVNWTKITTGNETFRYDDRLEFKNLDNPNYYKYHAIIADAFTSIRDVKLFGVRKQGSSTLHDGTLTLVKNLDVPRIGPPLDADDTPRRDRLVVEYNTHNNPLEEGVVRDTSGRGNDGVFYGGASYDASAKALILRGGDQHIITNMNNTGDTDVSISFWIKRTADTDPAQTVVMLGTAATGTALALDIYDDGGNIYWWTQGGENVYDGDGALQFPIGKWVHVTGTRTGRTAGYKLYIDGVDWTPNMTESIGTALTLPDNAQVTIGSRSDGTTFNTEGHISNFKLYDVALTAEEVYTLYDMGRCSSAIPKAIHIMGGLMRFNQTLGKFQVHNGVQWYTIGGVSASGGTITHAVGYTIHTFTSSGTFTVYSGGEIEYLMIAGGGGGGSTHGGAGGAGGGLIGTESTSLAASYTVTVGAGGAGDTRASGNAANGSNGSLSEVRPWLAGPGTSYASTAGGGGGGSGYSTSIANSLSRVGSAGGSGGGGGPFHAGGAAVVGSQGNSGGSGRNPGHTAGHGGGGGGRGGAGGQGTNGNYQLGVSGAGGNGIDSTITGVTIKYAGGGSGGRWGHVGTFPNLGGAGGVGTVNGGGGHGGGVGAAGQHAANGGVNTGGGGGGGGDGGGRGGNGGSGIVILRYLT